MPDHAVFDLHIQHRRAAKRAGVGWLAAALGVEGALIQRDRRALIAQLACDNTGAEARQVGIGEVQSFGGHGLPFWIADWNA